MSEPRFEKTGHEVTVAVFFTLDGVYGLEFIRAVETRMRPEMSLYERLICAASAGVGFLLAKEQSALGLEIDCTGLRLDCVVPLDDLMHSALAALGKEA